MRRSTRYTTKKTSYTVSDASDDDKEIEDSENIKPPKKPKVSIKTKNSNVKSNNNTTKPLSQTKKTNKENKCDDGSSSESDIENYLQPVDKIDFNSDFFKIDKQREEAKSFDAIENNIFAGINRLSDSESENELDDANEISSRKKLQTNRKSKHTNIKTTPTRHSFHQLQEYTKKIEEAKKVVQKYEAKKMIKQGKQKLSLNKQSIEEKLNVTQLLALGETKANSSSELQDPSQMNGFDSDSEKEDWEEVEQNENETKNIVPKEGVQVTVDLPGVMRKKKGIDLMASIKRRLNRIRKQNQILVHKVHLLGWIAHGNYINKTLNNENVLAMALSLLPSKLCHSERITMENLKGIVKWYQGAIKNIEKSVSEKLSFEQLMKLQINSKQAFNKDMFVYIFICILRALNLHCRLVLSFQVAPLRPPDSELHSLSTKSNVKNKKDKKRNLKQESSKESDEDIADLIKESESITKTQNMRTSDSAKKKKNKIAVDSESKDYSDDEENESDSKKHKSDNKRKDTEINGGKRKNNNNEIKDKAKRESKNSKITKETKAKSKGENKSKSKTKQLNDKKVEKKSTRLSTMLPQLDGVADSDDESEESDKNEELSRRKSTRRLSQRKKSLPTYMEADSDEDFVPETPKSSRKINNKKDSNDLKSTKSAVNKRKKSTARKNSPKTQKESENDSDYAPESSKKQQTDESDDNDFHENTQVKVKRKPKPNVQKNEKMSKTKKGLDIWLEVYLENDEKWISVDVIKGQVNCVSELYSRASHPITYIVAWNNNNTIKDVTQRYCPNCNTITRKLRIDKNWWDETVKPFEGEKTELDKKEDKEIAQIQLEKPLPTSIAEYKNHPLYALKRHLLKFQALYPPEPIILGFIRKEAVYPRECVYTLHSRDIWIKQAKVVKPGEKPYKIVTRPIWDKINKCILKDQPLDIFGEWQLQDYEPPTAENGIVPRNEYGNVELFKSCMLPKKCVHLRLEGLNKVARKMRIDCASAIVGFDVHHGWIHPVYDGYVVCEEYEEVLIAAWHMEKEEQEKRELEKLEKRVYGNWKKLIKGLLIRERLNARYNFAELKADESPNSKKRKLKEPKSLVKKQRGRNKNQSDSDDCNE